MPAVAGIFVSEVGNIYCDIAQHYALPAWLLSLVPRSWSLRQPVNSMRPLLQCDSIVCQTVMPVRNNVCSLSAWIFALLTSQFCEGLVGLYRTKLAQLISVKSRARREKEECRYSLLHWLERHKHSFINVPQLATFLFLWAEHTLLRIGINP